MPTVPTSRCYFFWPVLIFGKSTRKTGENRQTLAKTGEKQAFFGAIFLGGGNWSVLISMPFATMPGMDRYMTFGEKIANGIGSKTSIYQNEGPRPDEC